MTFYCVAAARDNLHKQHHDDEYGYPITDDMVLFERYCLEIMQAGLSWALVLRKRQAFGQAFAGFDPHKVAQFSAQDVQRLMDDPGIVRNRLKIQAIIHNARVVCDLKHDYGSFVAWMDAHHPLSLADWVKLFKKTFKFCGREMMKEFLMSTGYISGAHHQQCPVFNIVANKKPAWMQVGAGQPQQVFADWPSVVLE